LAALCVLTLAGCPATKARPSQETLPDTAVSGLTYNGVALSRFLGVSIADALALLGKTYLDEHHTGRAYAPGGGIFFPLDRRGGSSIVESIEIEAKACTYRGISLNKSRAELISLLGEPLFEQRDEEGEYGGALIMHYEINGCFFRVCIGDDDEAFWIEAYESITDNE
jgi:hypothetical protein